MTEGPSSEAAEAIRLARRAQAAAEARQPEIDAVAALVDDLADQLADIHTQLRQAVDTLRADYQ